MINALERRNVGKIKYNIDQLDKEHGEEIAQKYLNGEFAVRLAEEFLGNKNYCVIFKILEKRGVSKRTSSQNGTLRQIKNPSPRKYSLNEDYFKTWSHDMAYILGLLATDGNIFEDRVVKIRLKREDQEILEKIKEKLGYSGNISLTYFSDPKTKEKKFPGAELCIYSKPLVESLENLGVIPNKTFTIGRFDFIPQEYELDFIRGVIDGDGSIGASTGERCKNNIQIRFRIFSASLVFVEYIQDVLERRGYGRPKPVESHPENKNYHIVYSICYSTKSSIKLYEENYRDSELHLKRKYDTFKSLIQARKEYEDSFPNKNKLKARVTKV